MKLAPLEIKNFLGAREVFLTLDSPVTLIAGTNGSGKSSIQEAVRMALTGEAVRVALKKDYNQLITEGAESGYAEVGIDGAVAAFITLPSGKTTPLTEYVPPAALPYVLDAQRFARLEPNERRAFLFGLMGLSAGGEEVKKRLKAKGCDGQKIETILPMLRAGFEAAHKEAQARARDEKASWRTVTGETYGEKKAASWAAEKPVFEAALLVDLQQRLAAADAELAGANQKIGALQADNKRHAEATQRLAELREKGKRYARIADKLIHDEEELKKWEVKVEQARINLDQSKRERLICPHCEGEVTLQGGRLSPWKKETIWGNEEENAAVLPEYEEALKLMQTSVANDKRDLAEADAAAKAIAELEAAVGNAPNESELNKARKQLEDIKAERHSIATKLAGQQDAERQAKQADERTAKAFSAHESVLAWSAVADALAPDGIPGELLSEALEPINARLTESANESGWPRVSVHADMSITANRRPYVLLSESEKWRADAMLAEAIAHLSKIKVLVLDRFDVLDLAGRSDMLYWLDRMAANGEIDTALIFGTLKAVPATLPDTVSAHWISNGVIGPEAEAEDAA